MTEGALMVRGMARPSPRRRFLGGLAASSLALVLAGCDHTLPISTPSLIASSPRRVEPTPLAPMAPPDEPGIRIDAIFGRAVRLEGVTLERDTVRPGDYLRVWLHWQSVAESQEDLRSVGQLVSDAGRVLANEDDQIGRRRRFLSRWEIGERSVDEMRVRIAPNVDVGEYGLTVGVLRPDNQTHTPITNRLPESSLWQEDAVLVGTIAVTSG
jgi:hypothetical protein